MSDHDLIRRGDALKAIQLGDTVTKLQARIASVPAVDADPVCTDCGGSGITYQTERRCACQTYIPAVQPTVKPLVWVDFPDRGAKARAWNEANYMIQKWSDGRWEITASYPGYATFVDGVDRFHPTLEAAKAAAQADYEARILSALGMQPTVSPELLATTNGVAALVEAAEKVRDSYWHSSDGVITGMYDLETALARVKGETK